MSFQTSLRPNIFAPILHYNGPVQVEYVLLFIFFFIKSFFFVWSQFHPKIRPFKSNLKFGCPILHCSQTFWSLYFAATRSQLTALIHRLRDEAPPAAIESMELAMQRLRHEQVRPLKVWYFSDGTKCLSP